MELEDLKSAIVRRARMLFSFRSGLMRLWNIKLDCRIDQFTKSAGTEDSALQ
jgi:hypothetical protein